MAEPGVLRPGHGPLPDCPFEIGPRVHSRAVYGEQRYEFVSVRLISGNSPVGLENSETRVGLRVRSTRGIPESGGSNPRTNRPPQDRSRADHCDPSNSASVEELCTVEVQSSLLSAELMLDTASDFYRSFYRVTNPRSPIDEEE